MGYNVFQLKNSKLRNLIEIPTGVTQRDLGVKFFCLVTDFQVTQKQLNQKLGPEELNQLELGPNNALT